MKNTFGLILLCVVVAACSDQEPLKWYKGNLHTHTYWSDGDEFPEMVLDWYKTNGYDFVALSDHNTLATDEKWKVIARSPLYEESFKKYLEKFGAEWVTYKTDTGRTQVKLKTFSEYKSKMESNDFLIIPSEEITNYVAGKIPVHVNATNVQNFIAPPNAPTVLETMQQSIDAVLKQRQETGVPMIPHINHPNFGWAITVDDMIALRGERFFEVHNGHPLVHNYGDSARMGTEAMWDKINIAYTNRNQPLMYGLATDDSHNYHQFGAAFANAGRGWIMVQAEKLDAVSLIAAMEAGKFYASTGVSLKRISFDNGQLKIEVEPQEGVTYKIEFIGVAGNGTDSQVLNAVEGTTASFEVTPDLLFVRARVTSSKIQPNPFMEGDLERAWTQPVSLRK
ncbi:MAG: PHP domain-containing protein [Bacteroidetes bacterium OLB12]|nr:MAG: PHP domain-containing protein [Bacteroidetes bacterium OLB12]